MDKISIQVSGDKELAAQFRALPAAVAREKLVAALEPAARLMESEIKSRINDSGNRSHPAGQLRSSIERKVTLRTKSKAAISIGTELYYARFVELGHALVHSKSIGIKETRRGPRIIRRKSAIGRVAPHPFMRPAFDENVGSAIDKINNRLKMAIASVVK